MVDQVYRVTVRLPSKTFVIEEKDRQKAEREYQKYADKEKNIHITFENLKEVSSNEKK